VTVFERADRIGGLLRFGIPQFKMEKYILERRLAQMEAEGVEFRTGVEIGKDLDAASLRAEFDALVLSGGATAARDLKIPGRELSGIYQAMHFLPMANRFALGEAAGANGSTTVLGTPPYTPRGQQVPYEHAQGRDVIIIGGGDTGADCLGTVHRQGCRSVHQFEIVPQPPAERASNNPWPQWSNILRTSSAHEEGGARDYQINTLEFLGDDRGHVRALRTNRVEMVFGPDGMKFEPIAGSEEEYPAQLVLLAMGFLGPERGGMLDQLGVELDPRGNVKADADKMTTVEGIFTAGDMTRGQSLIVWAIAEGRQAAAGVDAWLMGSSDLPRPLDLGNDQRPFA
jgi:glutamate synthase (NADPH/NADH) small chain